MDCQSYRRWIHEMLDGDLDCGRRAELERHLAECADCRRDYREAVAIETWARALPLACAPADFADRVFARIAAHPSAPRISPARAAGGIAAAGCAALVAGWLLGGKIPYDALLQAKIWAMETLNAMAAELWAAGGEAAAAVAEWWTAVVARPPATVSQIGLILTALAASVAMAGFNFIQRRKVVKE